MTGLALGFGPVTEQVGGHPTPEGRKFAGAVGGSGRQGDKRGLPQDSSPLAEGTGGGGRRRAEVASAHPSRAPRAAPQRVLRDLEEPLL